MRKDQLIVVGLIILVGLAVAFFGRAKPTPEDAPMRIQNVLIERKVAVLVVVDPSSEQDRTLRDVARRAVSGAGGRAGLVVLDRNNPVERESVKKLPPGTEPRLAVIGLDGQPVYEAVGEADPDSIARAIEEGLTKPPIEVRTEPEGGHQH